LDSEEASSIFELVFVSHTLSKIPETNKEMPGQMLIVQLWQTNSHQTRKVRDFFASFQNFPAPLYTLRCGRNFMFNFIKSLLSGYVKNEEEEPPLTPEEITALIIDESKLVRAKRKFIQEQRFLKEGRPERSNDRLPPGQTLTDGFPVLDLGMKPNISTHEWELRLDGAIETPITIDWSMLRSLPQHNMNVDIHCVTAWSRFDNEWDGVLISTILELCKPLPTVKAVMLEGYDGYKTNLLFEDFSNPKAMLATSWQGNPLTVDHGAPVRFVLPHLYFWKSAKWIKQITFMTEERRGFWEAGGYHVRGDPWLQQRYRGDEPID
jgi:DMSO/TMAO reductase YedYZ molybdopterin-dependent catalytic subunit